MVFGWLQRLDFRLAGALFLSFAITAVLLLPFCDFIYSCGCAPFWAGAADLCNVYVAGVSHCPWCEPRDPIAITVPFVAIFLGQGFSIYYFDRKSRPSFFVLLALGILVFLVLGALNGFIFKLIDNYPHFF